MTGTSLVTERYLFPSPVSWGYPHMEVLVLSTNERYSVYRKFRNANATSPTDWKPSGRSLERVGGIVPNGANIAVRAWQGQGNRTDIYVRSDDSLVYRKSHNDDQNWTGGVDEWEPINRGTLVSQPAVLQVNQGRSELVALATGARTTITYQTGGTDISTWSAVENLGGGGMQFDAAIVSWGGGRRDVFGVSATTNRLMHTFRDSAAGPWATFSGGAAAFEDLGGFLTTTPVVISRANGTLDVFGRGGDGGLWHLAYEGDRWAPWRLVSGQTKIQAQPDALSWEENRIDIFVWGTDGSALTTTLRRFPDGRWEPDQGSKVFNQIGTGLTGPPKAISDRPGSLHLFAYGQAGKLLWKHNENAQDASRAWPADFVDLGTPDV
jgi:hypothetical protein